jgi:hypothetical protein
VYAVGADVPRKARVAVDHEPRAEPVGQGSQTRREDAEARQGSSFVSQLNPERSLWQGARAGGYASEDRVIPEGWIRDENDSRGHTH